MTAPATSCRETAELLSDLLEDALAEPAREPVEAHLSTCADCCAYLAQLRTTIALLGDLRQEDEREPALDELLRAFRGRDRG